MKGIENLSQCHMATPEADFFRSINQSFSTCFSNAMKLALTLEKTSDAELAAKRSFAYNPQNSEILDLFPQYEDTLTLLSSIISSATADIQKDNSNLEAWLLLGYCYLQFGDFPNAFAALIQFDCEKLEKENDLRYPEYYYYALSIIYHHFNYQIQSFKWYTKLMNCSKFSSFLYKDDFYYRLGILCRSLSKYSESIQYFTKIIDSPPNGLKKADIQFQIAYTYQLFGKNEEARTIYKQLLDNYPNNIYIKQQYILFLFLSQSTFDNNLLNNIIGDSLSNKPNPQLLFFYACILLKKNDLSSAYDYFKQCVSYYYDSPEFWCLFGILYAKNEQWTDAIMAFQRSLYVRNEFEEGWLNLGYSYEHLKDIESASRIYQTALMNCPQSSAITERTNNLAMGRSNVLLYDISDLSKNYKYFPQVPQKAANEYISAIPYFPAFLFGEEDDSKFSKMATFPASLFEDNIE